LYRLPRNVVGLYSLSRNVLLSRRALAADAQRFGGLAQRRLTLPFMRATNVQFCTTFSAGILPPLRQTACCTLAFFAKIGYKFRFLYQTISYNQEILQLPKRSNLQIRNGQIYSNSYFYFSTQHNLFQLQNTKHHHYDQS